MCFEKIKNYPPLEIVSVASFPEPICKLSICNKFHTRFTTRKSCHNILRGGQYHEVLPVSGGRRLDILLKYT